MNSFDVLAIFILLTATLLLLIALKYLTITMNKISNFINSILSKLKFNAFIRMLIELSVNLTVSSILNYKVLNFKTKGETLSSLTCILVLPAIILFNIWSYAILLRNRNSIMEGKGSK